MTSEEFDLLFIDHVSVVVFGVLKKILEQPGIMP
jgi:hypothetical protein